MRSSQSRPYPRFETEKVHNWLLVQSVGRDGETREGFLQSPLIDDAELGQAGSPSISRSAFSTWLSKVSKANLVPTTFFCCPAELGEPAIKHPPDKALGVRPPWISSSGGT